MSDNSSILFGAGCFWCVEAVFTDLRGVISVIPGYAGGHLDNPSYEEVYTDKTGHAEIVKITFNPKEISLEDLLRVFFTTHDPTQQDGQGHDIGTRYRSVIFGTKEQQEIAHKILKDIEVEKIWQDPIITEIQDLPIFYPAEEYHHDYFARNPEQTYCTAVIAPKVAKARKLFRDRLKK